MWIDLPLPVTDALDRLRGNGFPAYLVGGCVRDSLRGIVPHDFDITTSATPEQTKRVFADRHVVETGIKHGTVTVFSEGIPLEITTFRTDGTYSDGRHPDSVQYAKTLSEDLSRRDFTVNAMAWSPLDGVVDLFGGREDLQNGVIRCVGDPEVRFREDALRILRGARFSSVLDFTVEPTTAAAMKKLTPLLANISSERIGAEFTRLLCGKGVERVLNEFRDLIAFFVPELRATFGFDQRTPHHCYDVFTHTVKVVAATPSEQTVRLAAFFHDIGKPEVFTCKNGRGHFYGHPHVSARIAEAVLRRLRMERRTIRDVCVLIQEHDSMLKHMPDGELQLLQRLPPDLVEPLLALMRADATAKADPSAALARVEEVKANITAILQNNPCLHLSDLAVGGEDLLVLGIPEGKAIGDTLRMLLEAVTGGKIPNRKEDLLQAAQKNREFPK